MEDYHKTRNCEGISYIALDYCPTDGTILTSNCTLKIDTHSTLIHDRALSWLGTGTSITSVGSRGGGRG